MLIKETITYQRNAFNQNFDFSKIKQDRKKRLVDVMVVNTKVNVQI